jgi:hypothetical protein
MQLSPRTQRFFSTVGIACSIVLIAAVSAAADTVYTYTGNPYTVFNGLSCPSVCDITATLDLTNPIPPNSGSPIALFPVMPVSFTVTDGSNTITQANNDMAVFGFETNGSGQITVWDFSVGYLNGGTQIDISSNDQGNSTKDETFAVVSYAENTQDPGTWTSMTTSAVPEPSSLAFVVIAASVLLVLRRRRAY